MRLAEVGIHMVVEWLAVAGPVVLPVVKREAVRRAEEECNRQIKLKSQIQRKVWSRLRIQKVGAHLTRNSLF